MRTKTNDDLGLQGLLRAYERREGERLWRPAGEFKNIFLNPFYVDLFNLMTGAAAPSLLIGALALGYGNAPTFARTDAGATPPGANPLKAEWNNPVTTLTAQLNNATVYTSLTVAALNATIPSGTTLQLGGGQTVTTSAVANPGATAISVTSFTTTQQYNVATAVNVTSWTPQRMSPTLASISTVDPTSTTISFYLAAANNTVQLQFTEAALLYNAPSLTPGGAGSWASHVAFSYLKPVNTDLRLDYVVARANT